MLKNQLTKYQRSRMCNCIACGKPITDNQQFEFCTTRISRFTVYAFIHSDCIIKAQKYLQVVDEEVFDDGK